MPRFEELIVISCFAAFLWALPRLIMRTPWRRLIPEAVFAGYVGALLYVVIFAFSMHGFDSPGSTWWMVNVVPLRTILELARPEHATQAIRQLAGNVVPFVPFGLLLPILWVRFRRIGQLLFAAALASLAIEILQLTLRLAGVISRSIDIDDVILNTLGALVGWAVWRVLFGFWRMVVSPVVEDSAVTDVTG